MEDPACAFRNLRRERSIFADSQRNKNYRSLHKNYPILNFSTERLAHVDSTLSNNSIPVQILFG